MGLIVVSVKGNMIDPALTDIRFSSHIHLGAGEQRNKKRAMNRNIEPSKDNTRLVR